MVIRYWAQVQHSGIAMIYGTYGCAYTWDPSVLYWQGTKPW